MNPFKGSKTRILTINLVLVLLIVGAGFWGYSSLHPKVATAALQTVTVSQGDVSASVTASGTVISPGDVPVSSTVSSQITSVNVKVGDKVSIGQTLGTVDNTSAKVALVNAQNALATAKGQLATQLNALQSAQTAVATAQAGVTTAQTNLTNQQTILQQNATSYQASVDAALKSLTDAKALADLNANSYQASVDSAKSTLDYDNYLLTNYVTATLAASPQLTLTYDYCEANPTATDCSTWFGYYNTYSNALNSYNNAVQSQTVNLLKDSQNLANLQTAYQNAQLTQQTNLTKDSTSLASYQQAVTTAQNSLASAQATLQSDLIADGVANLPAGSTVTAADLISQQNTIAADQATLDQAQKNFDGTVIKSPVAGVVGSISAFTGSTAPTAVTNNGYGTVTGWFVITGVTTLQVRAGFSESDIAKLALGQNATVSFTALPNANAPATVTEIDQLPTTSSGATTYDATFSLTAPVTGLRSGMTATVTDIVLDAPNAISVTSRAVTIRGTRATVNLVTTVKGKQVTTRTSVVVGIQGDSADQIISGLKVGDKVALPTVGGTVGSNGFPSVTGVPSAIGGAGLGASAGAGAGAGGFGGARG
jgi:multidrug efflux pump subunit AcrA (membrane-fusion protein)